MSLVNRAASFVRNRARFVLGQNRKLGMSKLGFRLAPKAAIPRDEIGPPGSAKSRLQERERLPFTAPPSRTTRKVDFPINNASART